MKDRYYLDALVSMSHLLSLRIKFHCSAHGTKKKQYYALGTWDCIQFHKWPHTQTPRMYNIEKLGIGPGNEANLLGIIGYYINATTKLILYLLVHILCMAWCSVVYSEQQQWLVVNLIANATG